MPVARPGLQLLAVQKVLVRAAAAEEEHGLAQRRAPGRRAEEALQHERPAPRAPLPPTIRKGTLPSAPGLHSGACPSPTARCTLGPRSPAATVLVAMLSCARRATRQSATAPTNRTGVLRGLPRSRAPHRKGARPVPGPIMMMGRLASAGSRKSGFLCT